MSRKASRSPSPPSSAALSRRSSYAYRAVKKVENVARRMSTPHFTLDEIEQRLENELRRESIKAEHPIDILRRSGENMLHSKKVLLLIVLLNVTDCVLVMSELLLDIHFIRGMVQVARDLTVDFSTLLRNVFPMFFSDLDAVEIHHFYNRIMGITYDVAYGTNISLSFKLTVNTSEDVLDENNGFSNHFSASDVPLFLSEDNVGKSLEEDVGYTFHKTSIAILSVLVFVVFVRVFCYGVRFFKEKLVLFDGIIVITSFILDIVFIRGLMGYAIEDAVETLAILIPWRVVRVSNSLVMAVIDQAHLKLKLEYKQKRKIQEKLEYSQNQCQYYKNILFAVREMFQKSEIPTKKLIECVSSVDPPPKKKKTPFKVLKKRFNIKCLKKRDGRASLPYAFGDVGDYDGLEELQADVKERFPAHKVSSPLTSTSSSYSADVNVHRKVGPRISTHSVHFEIASSEESDCDSDTFLEDFYCDIKDKDENMNA